MNKKLILQIRSLYSLLFAVSLSLSSVAAFAQPAPPRITITMADVPMERVIDAIEKQSSYLFAIDANVNISQKVSVSCTDASVETALTQMVKGTDVAYRIDASNVVLSAVRKEVSAQPRSVSGKVLDAQGNPVVGAAVIVKGTTVGTSTGAGGDFKQASEFYGNERYERGRRRYTPYYNNRVNYGKNDDASESQKPDRKASNAPDQETKVYSYPHKLKAGEHIAINRADTTELMKIPGIGSYYARTIVKYRDKLGGFASAEQLAEIEGFPESAIAFIQIDADNIHRLNINKLTLNQLRNHPYLNFYQAKEICDYRRQRGPIKSLNELKLLKDFPPDEIERLKPYICF